MPLATAQCADAPLLPGLRGTEKRAALLPATGPKRTKQIVALQLQPASSALPPPHALQRLPDLIQDRRVVDGNRHGPGLVVGVLLDGAMRGATASSNQRIIIRVRSDPKPEQPTVDFGRQRAIT